MTTIETLEAEAEKYRLILRKIETLIRDLQELARPQDVLALRPHSNNILVVNEDALKPVNLNGSPVSGMKQIDAIQTIIRAKGQASAREIFGELQRAGIAPTKFAYLSSVLSRSDDKFERVGKGKKSRWKLLLPPSQ